MRKGRDRRKSRGCSRRKRKGDNEKKKNKNSCVVNSRSKSVFVKRRNPD